MLSDIIFEMTQQLKLSLSLNSEKYDGAILNELQEITIQLDKIHKQLLSSEIEQ